MIAAAAATTASEGGTVVDDAHDDDCTVVLYFVLSVLFSVIYLSSFSFRCKHIASQAKDTKIGENAKITIYNSRYKATPQVALMYSYVQSHVGIIL